MSLSSTLTRFANEDISAILKSLQEKYPDAKLTSKNLDRQYPDDMSEGLVVSATFTAGASNFTLQWAYTCEEGSDDVYMDIDIRDLKKAALKKAGSGSVNASSSVRAGLQPVMAADDEAEDDFGDDLLEEDAGIEDALDDIGDKVEDMQDQMDEIEEDEPNIELDNNIDGHYIAECEKCQGVFISAVIESDQVVDHISGVCPLCGKESDQYLKWVIKAVDR